MKTFIRTASMIFGLALAFAANAGQVVRLNVPELGTFVNIEILDAMNSAEGETKVAFLKRVGAVLQTFSESTGYEACSKIWSNADATAWGVRITSARAHNTCVITNLSVAGMTATEEGIHSHPPLNRYRANETDLAFIGGGVRLNEFVYTEGAEFSPKDFGLGAGYLVTRGSLLYQHGRGTVENMGEITTQAAPTTDAVVATN